MYPAAYNWVLGVMASQQSQDPMTGWRARFSNYDCTPHDSHEYELLAPGVDVWSTLPVENYAAWDGTSMATPIVSGIAALLRTQWSDKDMYSSRFIMGQIAANASPVADAYAALTVAPEPELSYLEHWLFDTEEQSPDNDDDGIVDAGETVDLAIVIRNHWGKADPVTVTLEARAEGAVFPDPYVTMITDTVSYGAVGSFNQDDNGLIYDENSVVVGVQHPFRFTIPITTPNNHVIPFRLTINAHNGLDPADSTVYTFQSYFDIVVQRGVQVFGEISDDTTWTADKYYIVVANIHVPEGVTLTIEPGTTIAFADGTELVVRGNLRAVGTKSQRIAFTSNSLAPQFRSWRGIRVSETADVALSYCDLAYALRAIDRRFLGGKLQAGKSINISHCEITNSETAMSIYGGDGSIHIEHNKFQDCLYSGLSNLIIETGPFTVTNNLFNNTSYDGSVYIYSAIAVEYVWGDDYEISGNSFLDNRLDVGVGYNDINCTVDMTGNYWGDTDEVEIGSHILDYYDTFQLAKVDFEPFLTQPSAEAPAALADASISPAGPLSVGTAVFTLTFSTDMDISVEPVVAFGPVEPYSDFHINGSWVDCQTWVGSFNITPLTGDGQQTLYVSKARGDADWMEIPTDTSHTFEIITSGTEAMNLQATGAEGHVDLMWTQNDFDLLAGFNLYRSTSQDGSYSRINASIIPPDVRSYRDTNVTPGQPYYYKFTVVKSDMTESDFSNVATATPVDTIPPVISHTPVTAAPPGLPLTLTADVTDNVGVQTVTLFYRAIGATTYSSKTMVHTTGNRYSATIAGSLVTSPGLEYYIQASDGVSTVRYGNPGFPYQILVEDRPVVTTVTPDHGPTDGGTLVTISGSNFQAGASVTFGGAVAGDVTVQSSNQISCTTPPHFPETVDVIVTNPDDKSGTLLRGFTYQSAAAQLSLPDTGGEQHAIVQVPVNAANVQGLAAASLTITFDPAVLQAQSASTGSLTPGWSLATNTGTPGEIRLSMASPGGTVSGSGVLATLEFEVVGSPGASSTLHFASVLLNDGAIPTETTDGSFAVSLVYDVSGTVHFWNGGVVSGTLLTLEGDRVYTGLSDASGAYTVSGAPADDYTLTPSKSDDVNDIGAYDASLALQHDAGLITLSGHAATAADVNKSGAITSMDAFYILQKAVDLITLPFPGAGVVWDFSPASRTYTDLNSDQTGQDFTAVLLGDVSGNWSAGGLLSYTLAPSSATPVHLSLPQLTARAGEQVNVPLTLEPAGSGLHALDITVGYDPAVLAPAGVSAGPIARGFLLSSNADIPGVLKIGLAGSNPIVEGGVLLNVGLEVIGPADAQSPLTFLRAEADEGAVPVETTDGQVSVGGSGATWLYLPLLSR